MANRVKQFRYYSDTTSENMIANPQEANNQPQVLSDGQTKVEYSHYVSGDVFGECFPVTQLGIQALPGTKFSLNNAVEKIIIGSTGIYELELNEQTQITNIQFDARSMELIRDNNNAFLIVDIIYDDGEE